MWSGSKVSPGDSVEFYLEMKFLRGVRQSWPSQLLILLTEPQGAHSRDAPTAKKNHHHATRGRFIPPSVPHDLLMSSETRQPPPVPKFW